MCSGAYVRDSAVQINMKLEAPLVFSNGFMLCSQDTSESSVIPNAAQGESYSFMPCRMVYLRHLELWKCGNFGICSKDDPQGQHQML